MTDEIKINQRTKIEWTSYLAVAYAEGFCEGENASFNAQMEAWAYLIATKQIYKLQGWFGRTAENLIIKEYINKEGQINWDLADNEIQNGEYYGEDE